MLVIRLVSFMYIKKQVMRTYVLYSQYIWLLKEECLGFLTWQFSSTIQLLYNDNNDLICLQ